MQNCAIIHTINDFTSKSLDKPFQTMVAGSKSAWAKGDAKDELLMQPFIAKWRTLAVAFLHILHCSLYRMRQFTAITVKVALSSLSLPTMRDFILVNMGPKARFCHFVAYVYLRANFRHRRVRRNFILCFSALFPI